ncbi:electron transfer flavoprotein beta subunit [Anaerobacterium chartisolvens]|uniref:Electron transfer flavoprotein small subunit n=1 Tax=Anaerobacterium chartisolvens TaxID=1297424 RepID=A0A369BBD9_9FIRM|nr:electron transfer flavoprotein subunit beta/FixA family protein [Anaerobacterium chartisolvens]RCX17918.1 electron transfer flavoprotein beta subunit [Anaerobacterium chartisolvens]
MKIVCLVKFISDVANFLYDYEKNVLVRENVKLILNPDDACALAFALEVKARRPDTFVEIVTMAPASVLPLVEDLLRRNADRAVIISDRLFSGSDTYVTSKIIARYLENTEYDIILTGTHSLDGDTSHVPSQVAELLKMEQMSNIVRVYDESLQGKTVIVEADTDKTISKYEIALPCILSIGKDSKYKLPFVRYKDLELDVNDRVSVIKNENLSFSEAEVGLQGSLTKVKRTFARKLQSKEKTVVCNDEEGIETVYNFLKSKGFV